MQQYVKSLLCLPSKELKVSIYHVTMWDAGYTYHAKIHALVEFGTDGKERFSIGRASYGSRFMLQNFPVKPLDAAFKDIASLIIKNEKVRNYINSH